MAVVRARLHETVRLSVRTCICTAAAVCDSALDAAERDVRFSLQVVLSFRPSLKVQGGYGGFWGFRISKSPPGRYISVLIILCMTTSQANSKG